VEFEYKKIYKSPYPMPEPILESLRKNKLIFFIGAGVSRIIGCKGWDDLAANLLYECSIRKYITYLEYEGLKQQQDSKKIITIVHSIFEEHGTTAEFVELLKQSFICDPKLQAEFDIYSLLNRFEALYVTTNADQHFDSFFALNNLIYTFPLGLQINKGKLYHLHGMEQYPDSLVFTVDQYLDRYNSEDFVSFLNNLFMNFTVVFIGYGLDEYEVLDHLFESAKYKNSAELKHFFLKAYFSYEKYLLRADQLYFNRMGVNVIGYEKDENGYAELYNILRDWEKETRLSTSLLIDRCDEIEEKIPLVETDKEINELMKLVETRTSYWQHFLATLSKNIIYIPKFIPYLIANGYFDITKNPPTIPAEDNPDFLSIPYWNILDYFLLIKNYLRQKVDHHVVLQLKEILLPLISKSSHIDNYHTDRVLIELIFSFPEEYIEDLFIEYLHVALSSNVGNLSVSGSIYENVLPACKLYNENSRVLEIVKIIFDSKERIEISYKKYVSLLDGYFLSECIKNYLDFFYEKCGDVLIDLVIEKLRKISDAATIPLFGVERLAKNYIKEQLDESKYDQMMTLVLLHLLNQQSKETQDKYLIEIKKIGSPIFKKIVILFETASILKEPPDESFLDSVRTGSESPVTINKLLKMDADEILEIMKQPLPMYGWDVPSQQGLIETIHSMISQSPNKITDQYMKYLSIPDQYKHAFLSSFLDNARNTIPMDWCNIFNYAEKIISRPSFWKKLEKKGNRYTDFILSAIADLVYHYLDNYIAAQEMYNIQKKLIFAILSRRSKLPAANEYNDISSLALNSTIGKSYFALIKLASFYAKEKSGSAIKWDPDILNYIFPDLSDPSASVQLCYVYGTYLPTFMYLDGNVFFDNFDKILSNKNDEQWDAFLTGYLFNVSRFNIKLHSLFIEHGIYQKVLSRESLNESCHERIAQYACIAYFNNVDNVESDNSLLRLLIINEKQKYLEYIIDFIWRQRKYFQEKQDGKIKILWVAIVNNLSEHIFIQSKERDEVYAYLLLFLSTIKILDSDIIRCVEFSIKHATENNMPFILENIIFLFKEEADENKKSVCIIMDMFIEQNVLFLYQDKEVYTLVELIFQYDKKCASRICMAYKTRGYDYLMDLYRKNMTAYIGS
jgi:hypothetical protein